MRICFYPGCSYASTAGYKESTEAVCKKLGIELEEIPDWNCCGATVMFGENKLRATALAARHFALAQEMGSDEIVTGCNACYATLRKAARVMQTDPALHDRAGAVLKELGATLDRIPRIRHLLEIIAPRMPEEISNPYSAIRAGAYYGCQLTRPDQEALNQGIPDQKTGSAELPRIMEDFLVKAGFEVAEHSAGTKCCGASHSVIYTEQGRSLSRKITKEIQDKGGQVAAAICPLCQFNLDRSQTGMETGQIPVAYFTQLAGLALGIPPSRLGLKKLLIPAREVITLP